MTKKKSILLMVVVIAIVTTFFAGCAHTFKCGWCSKEVHESGHKLTVLGQEIEMCDECYNQFQSNG